MPSGCASSSCVTTLGSTSSSINGGLFSYIGNLALDGAGNVYFASPGNDWLVEQNLVTPPNFSFDYSKVGSKSSDSPQTATVKNIGNAALTFPAPGTGQNPTISAGFTLDTKTTCPEVSPGASAGTLAAGASCNLAVDFIPTIVGPTTGTVVVSDNNLNVSNATQIIGLSGTGLDKTKITPTVTVRNSSNITKAQALQVTITVSGGAKPQPVRWS
jgi:hypothetical protein